MKQRYEDECEADSEYVELLMVKQEERDLAPTEDKAPLWGEFTSKYSVWKSSPMLIHGNVLLHVQHQHTRH